MEKNLKIGYINAYLASIVITGKEMSKNYIADVVRVANTPLWRRKKMTVAELIEKLKQCDGELSVWIDRDGAVDEAVSVDIDKLGDETLVVISNT